MDLTDFEFFTFIQDLSFDRQRLPEKFANLLKGRELHEVKLREADAGRGSLFDVEVFRLGNNDIYLGRGWELFARSYNLDLGYFLLFNYDGVNVLTVKVFDLSMCRKHYQHDNSLVPGTVLDQFCVFPKGVILDDREKAAVKNCCVQNRPKLPFYICRIVKSHLEAKGKMYFNQEYTKTYLSRFVTEAGTIEVKMYDNTNEKMGDVTMQVGVDNRATITREWLCVIKDQKWKVGHIVMFWFQPLGAVSLKLNVQKI